MHLLNLKVNVPPRSFVVLVLFNWTPLRNDILCEYRGWNGSSCSNVEHVLPLSLIFVNDLWYFFAKIYISAKLYNFVPSHPFKVF